MPCPDFNAMTQKFLRACDKRRWDEARELLDDAEVDIHALDEFALRQATRFGELDVVEKLVRAGADIHARDDEALRLAARHGSKPITRFLLDHGANPHAKQDQALCSAALNGWYGTAQALIEHGADIHAQQDTPLRLAMADGMTEIISLLYDNMNAEPFSYEDAIREARTASSPQTLGAKLAFKREEQNEQRDHDRDRFYLVTGGDYSLASLVQLAGRRGDKFYDGFLRAIDLAERAGVMDEVLDPELWAHRTESLKKLWDYMPYDYKAKHSLDEVIDRIRLSGLRERTRKLPHLKPK